MAVCVKNKEELENSLVKTIRIVCRNHIKNSQTVESVEGLFGVTIKGGHTFLFNIKEIRTSSPEKLKERNTAIVREETHSTSLDVKAPATLSTCSVSPSSVFVKDSSPKKETLLKEQNRAIGKQDSDIISKCVSASASLSTNLVSPNQAIPKDSSPIKDALVKTSTPLSTRSVSPSKSVPRDSNRTAETLIKEENKANINQETKSTPSKSSNNNAAVSLSARSLSPNRAFLRDSSPIKDQLTNSSFTVIGRGTIIQIPEKDNNETLPVGASPAFHEKYDHVNPEKRRSSTPKRPIDRQTAAADGQQDMRFLEVESPDKRRKLSKVNLANEKIQHDPVMQADPRSQTGFSTHGEQTPQVALGEPLQTAPPAAEYEKILVISETGYITCTLCNQVFSSRASGRRHVNFKHFRLGESCPFCQRLFRCQDELNDHMVGEHSGDSRGYLCPECNKGFKSKHTLKEHIRKVHRGIRRFRCYLCGEGFERSKACRQHLATKHPQCPECGMSLVTLDGHVCNTPALLSGAGPSTATATSATHILRDPRGPAPLGHFRLNKRALGDLAKCVAEQVVSAAGGGDGDDLTNPTAANSEARNNQGGQIRHLATGSENRTAGQPQPNTETQEAMEQNNRRGTTTETQSIKRETQLAEIQDDEDDEEEERHERRVYLSGMQTPSPASSDISDSDDCALMDLCPICEQEFNTQYEYQAHMQEEHPWCKWCSCHVRDVATHQARCQGRHIQSQREEEALQEVISIDD